MPRYRSYSWDDQRAMDKYYEYMEEACECGLDEDAPDELCYLCERRAEALRWHEEQREKYEEAERKRKEAALAAHPWREQIVTIRAQLDAVAQARGLGEKLPAVRILLTNLLSQQAFIAVQPKFRAALVKKVAELRADPQAEPLTELFDHMDRMLEGLKGREDFKA